MQVTIEYFGPAREASGFTHETIEIEAPTTASRLIASLAKERGGKLAALLLGTDGGLSPSILLAVENRQVDADRQTELRDGDEIVVIPPVSGG